MKKSPHIYSYSSASGVEHHTVVARCRGWITILSREGSIFTQLLRTAELDAGRYYYTTPTRAIKAFIVKAEAAIADKSREASHADWREALRTANERLKCQIATRATSNKYLVEGKEQE